MNLTPRESALAACILDALSDKEISRAMGWSSHSTVERALFELRQKVGAKNRVALALKLSESARQCEICSRSAA
jgi:DNA-binding NarL/FixJ family response regulator